MLDPSPLYFFSLKNLYLCFGGLIPKRESEDQIDMFSFLLSRIYPLVRLLFVACPIGVAERSVR